jgi:hypothetical protein
MHVVEGNELRRVFLGSIDQVLQHLSCHGYTGPIASLLFPMQSKERVYFKMQCENEWEINVARFNY